MAGLARSASATLWPAAVAVSGGGDSLALMHLLAGWAAARGMAPPVVLTVDHGLRPGSKSDSATVLGWAKAAGLAGVRLTWKGAKPKSDIEAAAREARFTLMGGWARRNRIAALFVGHTRDDQAETFLLRLARGSGLDGLSAMRALAPYPVPGFAELAVARPLIGHGREDLRGHLRQLGQPWLEDPMNDEARFSRVRIRAVLAALDGAGLSAARIVDAAGHLGRAREALDAVTDAVLARTCRAGDNAILLDPQALTAAPREIGLRALSGLLMAVAGAPYRPRFERLERLFDSIASGTLGGGATLHGCRLGIAPKRDAVFGPGTLSVRREGPRLKGAGRT